MASRFGRRRARPSAAEIVEMSGGETGSSSEQIKRTGTGACAVAVTARPDWRRRGLFAVTSMRASTRRSRRRVAESSADREVSQPPRPRYSRGVVACTPFAAGGLPIRRAGSGCWHSRARLRLQNVSKTSVEWGRPARLMTTRRMTRTA
jgi:hypothetical protein